MAVTPSSAGRANTNLGHSSFTTCLKELFVFSWAKIHFCGTITQKCSYLYCCQKHRSCGSLIQLYFRDPNPSKFCWEPKQLPVLWKKEVVVIAEDEECDKTNCGVFLTFCPLKFLFCYSIPFFFCFLFFISEVWSKQAAFFTLV